jgi:ornithine--oxo-acid transaminase
MVHSEIVREQLYCAHNYEPLPVVLVRGQGVNVWDDQGNQYIDMMSAYSALNHGHCHPTLVKALQEQASKLSIISRAFYSDKLGLFLETLCQLSGFDKALPMNTGAEAVETALKAARKWAYFVKQVPDETAEIIVCQGNFHGRTIAIIGMSSERQYRLGFGPFPPGFKIIPYGDINALKEAITPNTAAFLVEPIQGEGGVIVPPLGYLKACAAICKQQNVLLICDEIQTGLGRTGKLFAFQHENIQPDCILLGKALGGGLFPVSVFLSKNEIMEVFSPGDHGSTFGGNPLAAAIGLAAIDVLIKENLSERAAVLGNYFFTELKKIQSPIIKEVRGKGLLLGIEINPPYIAHDICIQLLKEKILTKETRESVIRLAPPLIITQEQLDIALAAIKKVFI